MNLPTILPDDLPYITAVKAAIDRGQTLQTNGRRMVLCDRLLPGFTKCLSGGEVTRNPDHTPEAA